MGFEAVVGNISGGAVRHRYVPLPPVYLRRSRCKKAPASAYTIVHYYSGINYNRADPGSQGRSPLVSTPWPHRRSCLVYYTSTYSTCCGGRLCRVRFLLYRPSIRFPNRSSWPHHLQRVCPNVSLHLRNRFPLDEWCQLVHAGVPWSTRGTRR